MWLSKSEYSYLLEESERLREKADVLDRILDYADKDDVDSREPICIGENFYLLSMAAFDQLLTRLQMAEDSVRSLAAERDWYKNAYAELKVANRTENTATHQEGGASSEKALGNI